METIYLNEEQIDEIAKVAVEKILVRMPDVIGNLIKNHGMLHKLNLKFYEDNPSFASNKSLVAEILNQVQGENPQAKYDEILKKAKPLISAKIQTINSLDIKTKDKNPDRVFKAPAQGSNGVF